MSTPLTDEQIIMKHDPGCRPRARMELEIVNQFLADAKKAGYRLRIDDLENGKDAPPYSYPSLRDAIFDLDDTHILVDDDTGEYVGWVYFVFGNEGWDCISDYTTNLETFLAPCLALSDRLANGINGLTCCALFAQSAGRAHDLDCASPLNGETWEQRADARTAELRADAQEVRS